MWDDPVPAEQQTTDRAWLGSPCSHCHQSPCCRNLPVGNLPVRTEHDLLIGLDLLEHENIEIGLKEDGIWTVFYTRTCRFLDPESSRCTIHGSSRQPEICRDYDAHRCWYRRVFASTISTAMIRLSRERLQWILDRVDYYEKGEISRVPDWELMMRELADIPLSTSARAAGAFTGVASEITKGPRSQQTGVPAPGRLAFPPGRPRRIAHFDLIRFRLGFPGVQLAITGNEWYFLLDAPERPAGRQNTAHVGEYHLTAEAASGCVAVAHEDIDAVLSLCSRNTVGRITGYPGLDEVRSAIRSGGPLETSVVPVS